MANPKFWYARNWNAYGEKCKTLTMLQHGAYTLLLDYYYSTSGEMQPEVEQLLRVCSSRGEAEDAAVVFIADKFFPVEADGMRHNSRADDELGIAAKVSSARREVALMGVEARKIKAKQAGIAQPIAQLIAQPIAQLQVDTVTDTVTDTLKPKVKNTCASIEGATKQIVFPKSFLEFYELYPRKKSKGDALKAFKKVRQEEYPAVKAGLLAAIKSVDWQDKTFIPYPASWLNARGWEDEITKQGDSTSTKPWYITASGIEGKVKEIEFDTKREVMVDYKIRLFKQLGITSDMTRQANIDWQWKLVIQKNIHAGVRNAIRGGH